MFQLLCLHLLFLLGHAEVPVCQSGVSRNASSKHLLQRQQRLNKSIRFEAWHLAGQSVVNHTRTSNSVKHQLDAAQTRVDQTFKSRKAKANSADDGDTYILHLVETCDAAASTCSGGLTTFSSSGGTLASQTSVGGSLSCIEWADGGIDRRRDGRRRRRRRRDETCAMASFEIDAGCQMSLKLGDTVSAFYGPGTYAACPCPQFFDETKNADEYLMTLGNHEALCDSAGEQANLALLYEVGTPVSEWGASCIMDYPVIMKDSNTGLYYVLEDAADPCYVEPTDALGSSTTLTSDDMATCSGFSTGGFSECLDVAAGVTAASSEILTAIGDESDATLAVVLEIAIPLVTWLLNRDNDQDLLNFNFCLGEWAGSEIAGASITSSLYADNCHYPPYVDTNTYNVIAMQLPVTLLNSAGLCAETDLDEGASFCVAYTGCSSGQPTFAMMLDGTAVGCLFGNSAVTSASVGLSQILSQGASAGLETIGWGLSLTGEFQKTFTIWNGDTQSVTIMGNVFRTIGINIGDAATKFSLLRFFPKEVNEFLQVSGTATWITQIEDGSMTESVQNLYSADSPVDVLNSLTKQSHYGSFAISIYFKFNDLTEGLLSDLYLGDGLTIDGLATTQSLDGVEPGLYLYASGGVNALSYVMDWFIASFSGIIDKIGGTNFASTLSSFFDGNSGSGGEFAVFLNTDSFGFLVEVAATADLFTSFPLAGSMSLGTLTVQCSMKLLSIGMNCAIGYDAPQWAAAFWKAINGAYEMVVGAVKDTAIAAWESAADAIGGLDLIGQWGKLADEAGEVAAAARGAILESQYYQYADFAVTNPEDAINQAIDGVTDGIEDAISAVSSELSDVGSAVTDVFSGRRRRRWFGNSRRRRKSIFR